MKSYHIYIPTRGRTTEQLTLSRLPKYIHDRVTLVCPLKEAKTLRKNFPTVEVLAQPDSIQTIAAKREWIMKQSPHKFAIMMDDDLYFYVFNGERHTVPSAENKEHVRKFWTKTLPKLCKKYHSIGFGTKAFAPKGGIKENYHLGLVLGFDKKAVKAIEWNRIAFYEDMDYTLQLLKKGIAIAVTYDMAIAQRKADAPGGLTGERTREAAKASLKKLLKLHPDVVKEKPPSASHPDSNTRVSWRGAAKIGGLV